MAFKNGMKIKPENSKKFYEARKASHESLRKRLKEKVDEHGPSSIWAELLAELD